MIDMGRNSGTMVDQGSGTLPGARERAAAIPPSTATPAARPQSTHGGMGATGRFFALNRRISRALTPAHVHECNVFGAYRKVSAMLLSHPDVTCVVDVGAGKSWHLPRHYKNWYNIRLVGLDIDGGEMAENDLLDDRIECDVVTGIPLASGSADLVMVHSGVEHFSDTGRFLDNAYRLLRPGGFLLGQFPGRYALFAIANRLLPRRLTRPLLRHLMDSEDLGFPAIYDRTNYSSFRKLVARSGFQERYYLPGYYGSTYFEFFVPLYLLSYAADMARFAVGIKDLASYNLWVLQKPGDRSRPDEPFAFHAWDE
jgi:SAM-dependent methyltransferase